MKFNYSKRILALTHWIEADSFVIDVGTDHAHLPLALVELGITRKILAIDNNLKPLATAEKNIIHAGFNDIIELRLNDGLRNINLNGNETIVISGLGGMLISSILAEAKQGIKINQKFILQPNWTWFELRKWLAENGFKIVKEQIVAEQNKLYSQLLVHYTGEEYHISDTDAFCGINIQHNHNSASEMEIYKSYLNRLKRLASLKARSVDSYSDIVKRINHKLENLRQIYY